MSRQSGHGHFHVHGKKRFVILTIAFVTRIATACDVDMMKDYSPLWQPSMGNATHVEYSNI